MATAIPLDFVEPVRLDQLPREVQETIRVFEAQRAAGTFVGIPGEQVRARLDLLGSATAKVAEHFHARGLAVAILEDGTPAEVAAYCDATFAPGDGPRAWLTSAELQAFFPLDPAPSS